MKRPIKILFLIVHLHVLALSFFCTTQIAKAQTIIRDTEIESYLSSWFAPIFEANNMSPEQVKIILVQSNNVNAFVAGGSNIFLYTGLIEKTDHPGELIGVMAHELAHITAGHLVRGRKALEEASYESILGTILGVGAAIVSGDVGGVTAGSLAGSSVAQRRFLATSRSFESSADQAAVRSMEEAGFSPEGLLSFMQKLEGQELLPSSQQSEYVRTHPLTANRITALQSRVDTSSLKNKSFSAEWLEQHDRMIAKLTGFINPAKVDWSYDDKDKSVAATYARSIAAYKNDDIDTALKNINNLIQREPKNPYFHEFKGQILVDFGRIDDAIPSYERAIALAPESGLIRTALAHAQIQIAPRNDALYEQAIQNLNLAAQKERRSTRVHRLLATAYGRTGKDSLARLHLAEEALLQRRNQYASSQAEIALKGLEPGSSAAIRANDIIQYVSQNNS